MRILAAFGLLATAGVANAELSSTWTVTSDYDYRGTSQSAKDPAIQASLDFSTEGGWYIGAWASTLDFGPGDPAKWELDIYTGFSGGSEDGLGWDVGINYYAYPDESDYNFPEIYGKLSYGMFSGGLYYSNDWVNSGDSAFYLNGGVSVPLGDTFSINANVGYSFGEAFSDIDSEYFDYSIGVGATFGKFDFELKYVDTNLGRNDALFSSDDVFNTEGRVILTISTTFPW
jgi:uncharacterized protein (TIGR02001 family)